MRVNDYLPLLREVGDDVLGDAGELENSALVSCDYRPTNACFYPHRGAYCVDGFYAIGSDSLT